jgi:glycosyltransferase involved in cell wall biosynthesis
MIEFLRGVLDQLAVVGADLRPGLRALRRRFGGGEVAGLVSVILPTRDRAGVIARAVESVLAQTYLNWELIVVDDGSVDNTAQVMRRYRAERRVIYMRRGRQGGLAARNAGLAVARGALIAYLDSDNDWDAGFLAGMVRAFDDASVQSAYGMLARAPEAEQKDFLFEPFDREKLLAANFIDINVFVHRRALFTRFGGFDVELKRLGDWDLVLRYTVEQPALAVEGPVANYRTDAPNRNTNRELFHPAYRRIRAKWRKIPAPARPPRVLYALRQYPQLSQTTIETELRALRRLGAAVEVFAEILPSVGYPVAVTVHRDTLEAAVAAFQPDVVHVHGLNMAMKFADVVAPLGVALTVRGNEFDVSGGLVPHLLLHPSVAKLYLNPGQVAAVDFADEKISVINNAFDTGVYAPGRRKDRRMVLRAGGALPSQDLAMFLQAAVELPGYRFVLCTVPCPPVENYADELLARRAALGSPAEILVNVPQVEVARLMAEAGIYLHTVVPDAPPAQPSSIVEAMASGCYVLARNLAPLVDYVGDGGAVYADLDEAARLIRATADWGDADWAAAGRRAEERAWSFFTGDDDFAAMYRDFVALSGQ